MVLHSNAKVSWCVEELTPLREGDFFNSEEVEAGTKTDGKENSRSRKRRTSLLSQAKQQ